jgi:hypothetical protein
MIFLWNKLILSEALKDVGSDLGVYDKGKIKASYEETPCVEDDFVIMSFISDG